MWCGKKKNSKEKNIYNKNFLKKEKEKVRKAVRYMSLEFLEQVRIKGIDFFLFFFCQVRSGYILRETDSTDRVWAILEGECG